MNKRVSTRSADYLLHKVLQLDPDLIDEFVQKLTNLTDHPLEVERSVMSEEFVALACSMYEMRRLRNRFLTASILGEPVWDMLLALYCFTARGEALSVSGLCHAANVPPTTALRWVQLLEQKKIIIRSKDRNDARRTFLVLTACGEEMMTGYLTAAQCRMAAMDQATLEDGHRAPDPDGKRASQSSEHGPR